MARQKEMAVAGLSARCFSAQESQRALIDVARDHDPLLEALRVGRVMTFEWDVAPDVVVRSANADEIVGCQANRTSGRGFFKWVHPEDQKRLSEVIGGLTPGKPDYTVAYRYVRPDDGRELVLEDSGRGVFDVSGKLVRVCGVARDITEKKGAEAELRRAKELSEAVRESEERFRALADGTPIPIWVGDAAGNNRFVNRAYCEFFGLASEHVQGMDWQQLLHAEDRALYVEVAMRAVREQQAYRALARVRRHDGAWRWVEVYAKPRFSAGGEFLGMGGSCPDVTERKEFQQELERLVAERTAKLQELVGELEHFSYTITHDMRSPLRAMTGFAEVVNLTCGEGAPKAAREALARISTSAKRMDCLITDALSYSRSVRQELPLTDVDTGALLRGMLDGYPELQPSRANIRLEAGLPVVRGNEAGLTQCFSNLLGNAVKFVRPGERAQIRVWSEERDGWVRIWVEDQGIGISREMLPRVFDMFSHGGGGYEGTGIGLALVRKVVLRMGGRLGVESEEGRGSRFWIELAGKGAA